MDIDSLLKLVIQVRDESVSIRDGLQEEYFSCPLEDLPASFPEELVFEDGRISAYSYVIHVLEQISSSWVKMY